MRRRLGRSIGTRVLFIAAARTLPWAGHPPVRPYLRDGVAEDDEGGGERLHRGTSSRAIHARPDRSIRGLFRGCRADGKRRRCRNNSGSHTSRDRDRQASLECRDSLRIVTGVVMGAAKRVEVNGILRVQLEGSRAPASVFSGYRAEASPGPQARKAVGHDRAQPAIDAWQCPSARLESRLEVGDRGLSSSVMFVGLCPHD